MVLNWIPSHVGIRGNETGDQAARIAAVLAEITTYIRPLFSLMREL